MSGTNFLGYFYSEYRYVVCRDSNDPNRVSDELLRWHFRQSVIAKPESQYLNMILPEGI